jgi:hypothetical protein
MAMPNYDPLRRLVKVPAGGKSEQIAKNPFIQTLSMFKYKPSAEDVNKTLWGDDKQNPSARKS